ncbi:MAG: glycosyltransferase family 2 protein [Thermococcus sp.]|nr:glycosyltransferase family 2 protein [Thermococcus sp.]
MPIWNEPENFVMTAINSLKHQNVVRAYPEMFEFIVVDGVPYVDKIRPLVDKVLHAPRGKLKARHLAIQHAIGDIIVSVDGDTYYPCNWLNLVLQPFHDPEVVAVTTTKHMDGIEPLANLVKVVYYGSVMLGRGSAFTKDAYFRTGGFNLSADEGDITTLQMEEEFMFYKRLSRVGKVKYVDAPVVHLGEDTFYKMKEGRGLRS